MQNEYGVTQIKSVNQSVDQILYNKLDTGWCKGQNTSLNKRCK